MAEGNGIGRLDRIEALLDKLADRQREFQIIQEHDHEDFKRDDAQSMKWQVLMQDNTDRFSADRDRERERLDQL